MNFISGWEIRQPYHSAVTFLTMLNGTVTNNSESESEIKNIFPYNPKFFFLYNSQTSKDTEMINFSSIQTFQEPRNPLNKFNTVKLSVFETRTD